MPVLERIELRGHAARSSAGPSGCLGFVFGLIFMGAGAGVFIVSRTEMSGKNAPDSIIAAVGAVFFLAGLLVFLSAFRLRRRKNVHDPLLADYPWIKSHAAHNAFGAGVKGLFGAGFLALFLTPFNGWAFLSDDSHFMVVFVVGIFDLILLLLLGHCGYLMLRGLKYGTSRLRFASFPYVLGKKLTAQFESPRRIEAESIEATLRCVQEAYEVRGTGKNRSTQVVCYQVYADVQHLRTPSGPTRLDLSFDLPDGDFETKLSERPPRYWELEVRSETPGIDYAATFLVPVYRR